MRAVNIQRREDLCAKCELEIGNSLKCIKDEELRTSERNDSLDKHAKELSEREKACALQEGEMEGATCP